jgi:hypothetical protein
MPLIAKGLTPAEVAVEVGMSVGGVRSVLWDPDGSKQRAVRARYKGECVDCGAETRSSGTSKPSPRCPSCAVEHMRKWTREKVVAEFHRFNAEYGRPPTATEWFKHRDDGYPTTNTVILLFGSWSEGMLAAGFTPRRSGERVERTKERECPDCGETFVVTSANRPPDRCPTCLPEHRRQREREFYRRKYARQREKAGLPYKPRLHRRKERTLSR